MTRLQLPPNPPGIRGLLDAESAVVDAKYGARHPAQCLTCVGQKFFTWKDAQGNPAEFDCHCDNQFLLHRYLSYCGVPLRYQRLGWDDLEYLSPAVMEQVLDYHEHQAAYINAGFGLVLTGGKGTGKTLLAHLLLKRLAADGIKCYATTFADMVNRFMGSWRDSEAEKQFDEVVRNAGVLYIDDLGREYKAQMERTGSVRESLLESTIRHRVANCQPFIITTNLSRQDILEGYGGHVASLLTERSFFVPVEGPDRRQQMNDRDTEEMRAGLTRPVMIS